MKSRNLTLGILILFAGVVALLSSLNLITFNWAIVSHLWPLALIMVGILILPIKNYMKAILLIVALAAGVWLYQSEATRHADRYSMSWYGRRYCHPWNGKDSGTDDNRSTDDDIITTQPFSEPFDTYERATLNVDFGAGELNIGRTCAELAYINSENDIARYNFRTEKLDTDIRIYVSDKGTSRPMINKNNNLNIALSDKQVWDFVINTGASDCDLDFSRYQAQNIDISCGVSDMEITLGGHPCDTHLSINSGVSEIDIKIPHNAACKVSFDTALTNRNLEGFEKISKTEYQTPGFAQAEHQIVIDLSCGFSEIDIERY